MSAVEQPRVRGWTVPVQFVMTPRVRARRILRTIAVVLLVGVVLWGLAFVLAERQDGEPLIGATVVLGDWVVRATDIGLAVAAIAVVLLVLARRLAADDDPVHRAWRTALTWSLAITVPLSLIGMTLTGMGQHPTVLSPSSDAGCRIVVLEYGSISHARVGMLAPGDVRVTWVGNLGLTGTSGLPSDQVSALPVSDGHVTLSWTGAEAALTYAAPAELDGAADIELVHPPLTCDA